MFRTLMTVLNPALAILIFTTGIVRGEVSYFKLNGDKNIYISIQKTSQTVGEVFETVSNQSHLNFAYDEKEIDLSRVLRFNKGEFLLNELLSDITSQTGLHFTFNKKLIIVTLADTYTGKNPDARINPVKGNIKDVNGDPMAGATVSVKGTKTTVQTDSSGDFIIDAPANGILIVSFSGYRQSQFPVNGRENLNIVLNLDSKILNEVVVFGYQNQKRSDVTGAVSIVDVSGVSRQPVGFVDQGLQGMAAGVRVTQSTGQPGDGVAIRIRGVGTINNNDPLIIIDGVPTKEGINFLSSDDIATITILKDAASASIYGSRSANGVVVITTRGGKVGRPVLSYQGYAGVQTHGTLPKMCDTRQYAQLYNEAAINDNADITNPLLQRKLIPDSLLTSNTDWLGAIFQTAPIQNHVLSISGGNGKTLYMVSANYFDQDG
ncbi:MAG: TonB-dependent receptor plug domain-containing protein, partial [Bacteroidota bacterium]|nr:TonB-dependent receptor plug domain-containing protein [Bacteroidota bacterium]